MGAAGLLWTGFGYMTLIPPFARKARDKGKRVRILLAATPICFYK